MDRRRRRIHERFGPDLSLSLRPGSERYISFGSEKPQLCFRFMLIPREGDRRVPANLYQRFAFNLSWSPEDLKEVPLKPRPHGDRASAAQLRKYRGG